MEEQKSFIYYWVNKDWNNVLPWEVCRAEKRGTCAFVWTVDRSNSYQFHRLLCSFFSAESDKGVASVQAAEWIHHQSQVPDGAGFLKERNQLILKQVSGYFADKYLTEGSVKTSQFQLEKRTPAGFQLNKFPSALSGKLSK